MSNSLPNPHVEVGWGPGSPISISEFERRVGARLPNDYREFLLRWNGGTPSPNTVSVPDLADVLVDRLYGVRDVRTNSDLEHELNSVSEMLPEGVIPIGHDPGGNLFLLCVKGDGAGQVWYWDSCLWFESSSETGNTYVVSNSFGEFLRMLH